MESRISQKHTLQIAYVILLTLGVPFYILTAWAASAVQPLRIFSLLYLPLYLLLFLFLGLLNIRDSFRAYTEKDAVYCVNGMLILKYGLVVFFIFNFLILTAVFLLGGLVVLIASRGTLIFALPMLLPWIFAIIGIAAFFTWLMLLPGAFWGVQVIRKSMAEGKLSPGKALLHGALQFIFLTDVLDAMYLSVRIWNRGKKSAAVIGTLYLAVIAWLIFAIVRIV